MRRSACRFVAAVSLAVATAHAPAETRPRYGGAVTVETRDSISITDPAQWPPALVSLVYDRLVRLDEHGEPQPALAVSWRHDSEARHWEFRLRSGARFHDGSPVTAAAVAASLRGTNIAISGESVLVIQSESPAPDLASRLADSRYAILERGADGVSVGSGPFRIAEWQPGRRALLAANDHYWGGRPFVDAVELLMAKSVREQSIDLELGKADLVELPVEDARRALGRGVRTWSSSPADLLALVFERGRPDADDPRLREALALSVDRAAIHNVLLEKQGEASGALLPQWLTGYAFLFPAARDLERARQIVGTLPKPVARLTVGYDAADALERPIAERIALNAREAGIAIQVTAGAKPDARLVRLRLRSLDPALALADVASALGAPAASPTDASGEALYQAERKLVEDFRVVPLVHLPEMYGLSPRIRNWEPMPFGDFRLDNVWLEARTP